MLTARLVSRTAIKLWVVLTFVFLAGRWLPGDPVTAMLGPGLNDPQTILNLKRAHGLDRSLGHQYAVFCWNLLQGDMGTSIHSGAPVATELGSRVRVSAFLGVTAFALAIVIGLPLGFYLACGSGSRRDSAITVTLSLCHSVPIFVVGLGLMYIGSYRLHWFPILVGTSPMSWVLPVAALAIPIAAFLARTTRQIVLNVLARVNLLTLHAFGIGDRTIWLRHVLRNAAPQCLYASSMALGYILSGNVFIETMFSCPGIGQLLAQSVLVRDYPVLQGTVLLIAAVFLGLNLAADLLKAVLDPRQEVL